MLNSIKLYSGDERGNFSVLFSMVAFLAVSCIAMAIDYAFMTSRVTKLQGFADSAVLAAAISQEKTEAKLRKVAKAHIDESNIEKLEIDFTLKLKDDVIHVETHHKYAPVFMGVIGQKKFDLSSNAAAPLLEVASAHIALVLDRTGSMQSAGNMKPLRNAAEKMIDTLEASEGDVKMSVVPFSDYVNVGTKYRNAPWADVEKDDRRKEKVCKTKRDVIREYDCRYEWKTTTNDGVKTKKRVKVCKKEYGEKYKSCEEKWVGDRWRGCMGSRNAPFNTQAKFGVNRITGIMNKWCGQQLLPMTDNFKAVKKSVKRLSGSGNTYMPAGLIWGWRTLDPGEPFTEASKGFTPNIRALVMMTDGQNTLTQDKEFHVKPDKLRTVAETNLRTAALCRNIKKDGIVLYAVAYNFPGEAASAKPILKACASDSTKFFDAKNSKELEEAFENIGNDISRIRLSN